jgi:putative spermidine/putrescine transport system permease protein
MRADGPGLAVRIAAGAVIAFLILPILIIFPLALNAASYLSFPPSAFSLRWVQRVAADPAWLQALAMSLAAAFLSAILALLLATAAAVALSRARFPGKRAVYAVVLMPMILPGIITSVSAYFFFSRIELAGSLVAIALGHTVLALPVALIILSATLGGFDIRLEQAAQSLGAGRLTAFRRVTLPLIAPGLVSAAIFAFLSSFDELLMALFLSGPATQTIPVRIWNAVQFQLDPSIAAVSAILVLVSVLALGAAALLGRDR